MLAVLRQSKHALRGPSTSLSRLISSNVTSEDRDIVIVGGGPVGLALASALLSKEAIRDTLQITLVEAGDLGKVHDWSQPPGTFSNRVSSLTNASQAFLQGIGAWKYVDEQRTSPMQAVQAWDGISDARISFNASELPFNQGLEGMARLTENLNLQRGLLRSLDSTNLQLLDKTKVQSIEPDEASKGGWPLVTLDNGRVLRARLLVGADGFNSPVRAYSSIPSFGWSYDTQAIVSTMVHLPRSSFENPNTTAYQRFLPTGPIAFLPLSPTRASLVWSTKPVLAKAILESGPGVLAQMINAAYRLPWISMQYIYDLVLDGHKTGAPISSQTLADEIAWREKSHGIEVSSAYATSTVSGLRIKEGEEVSEAEMGIPPADSYMVPPLVTAIQDGSMASFPLRFNHAESYIGQNERDRTVLVGDAAHTIHPLAGQGLNLGLGDVECLANTINDAILTGSDIGSHHALLPYTRERYFENHKVMSAVDKLHKLYSTTAEPVVWARTVGVEVLNEMDTIKAAIMAMAGSTTKSTKDQAVDLGLSVLQGVTTGLRGLSTLGGSIGGLVSNGLSQLSQKVLNRKI